MAHCHHELASTFHISLFLITKTLYVKLNYYISIPVYKGSVFSFSISGSDDVKGRRVVRTIMVIDAHNLY